MGRTNKILRWSIFLFLQNYHYFISTPTLLAVPFAISVLLSQCYVSSSYIFQLVHVRLRSIFLAAGFPLQSELINLKLSQTILTFLFVSPFMLSFLLLAKSSVIIKVLSQENREKVSKSSISSLISVFKPLLITQLCNILVILSSNATCFFVLVIFFNFLDVLGLSSSESSLIFSCVGAIVYSVVLANAYIICNLSLVVSGQEKRGGFTSILKACVLMHGRASTALTLAVAVSTALAGVEALFQYRVLRAYYRRVVAVDYAILIEGMIVSYMYSLLLVLDTVITCVFLRSCRKYHRIDREDHYMYSHQERLLPY